MQPLVAMNGYDAAMNGYETLGGCYVDQLAMMVMTPFNGNEPFGGMSTLVDMHPLLAVNGYDASMDGYETLGGCVRWL